jgi:hypothetical protein
LKELDKISLTNAIPIVEWSQDGLAAIEADDFRLQRVLLPSMYLYQRSNGNRKSIDHDGSATYAPDSTGNSEREYAL